MICKIRVFSKSYAMCLNFFASAAFQIYPLSGISCRTQNCLILKDASESQLHRTIPGGRCPALYAGMRANLVPFKPLARSLPRTAWSSSAVALLPPCLPFLPPWRVWGTVSWRELPGKKHSLPQSLPPVPASLELRQHLSSAATVIACLCHHCSPPVILTLLTLPRLPQS